MVLTGAVYMGETHSRERVPVPGDALLIVLKVLVQVSDRPGAKLPATHLLGLEVMGELKTPAPNPYRLARGRPFVRVVGW